MQERSLCEHRRLVQVLLQKRLCGHTQAKHMRPTQNSVTSVCHSVYPYLQYAINTQAHAAHTHLLSHSTNVGPCVGSEPPQEPKSQQ